MPERMRAADAAWIGLDRPEHLMVVTAVLRLETPITVERLRDLVRERLLPKFPRLRARAVISRWPLLPRWAACPDFDIGDHVTDAVIGEPLPAYVGRLMSMPLDQARPLWTLTLVHGPFGDAVVARLHHCLADGIALAGVLLELVDGAEASGRPPASKPSSPRPGAALAASAAARSLLGAVRTIGQVTLGRSESLARLRAPASAGRVAAWTEPIDLARVKATAATAGVSLNDVLLAAVAGGLRQWLLDAGERPVDLRVMIPVDLRQGASVSNELGNRFGIAFVSLPVSTDGGARRLELVHAATLAAKRSAAAPASYLLLRLVGVIPRWGQGLAAGLLSRVATVIVTNVPGPRKPLTLADSRLSSIVFWVPHVGSIGIGFSIFSYAGTVTIGVAVNESLRIDPAALVAAVQAELQTTTTG